MGQIANNFAPGGITASVMHPVVLVLLVLTSILTFILPRKYVIPAFLLLTFLTPFGEQLYVFKLHFFVYRILILCGWARICSAKITKREQMLAGGFNEIDKIFLVWALISALTPIVNFGDAQSLIYQSGLLLDAVGGYFLYRCFIQDMDDIFRIIKTFAFIVLVLGMTMVGEKVLGENVFGFIGGRLTPFIRDGAIRSQATFEGPIPAGTFAGTALCLFMLLWKTGKAKLVALVGLVGSTVMVVTSASSTPLMAYLAVLLGLAMWPIRKRMRLVRWGLAIFLVSVHLIMKAPVWFLIDHVDLIAGNSGWQRAEIIDQCIRHFGDWWLIGIKSTAAWGFDMWDHANQFVQIAEDTGLAALVCFIMIISRCFARVGNARKAVEGDQTAEWTFWLLGVCLFSHVVAFFGIEYLDQTKIGWDMFLVMISVATAPILVANRAASPSAESQLSSRIVFQGSHVMGSARNRLPS